MTKTYDWLVVGGGITGASLAFELQKQGARVLLVEREIEPENATRYSYGGLAYWSGTTELTRQLCTEGIELYRQLSAELDAEIEFRDTDLLLSVDRDADPQLWRDRYSRFAISPNLLTPRVASELEPLLNPEAISGVLQLPHGHVNPVRTARAYLDAFQRLGGEIAIAEVESLWRENERLRGVKTRSGMYGGDRTVICAGAASRALLQAAGIATEIYFTHAELVETSPVANLHLRAIVMPADNQRLSLETQATQPEKAEQWDEPNRELAPPILDPGAVQFADSHLCFGQISRALSDRLAPVDAIASERAIREGVGKILPALRDLPGKWHHCLIAFRPNSLPLVGAIPGLEGAYVFSGFTSTLLLAPPLARHFARRAAGESDPLLERLALG